MTIYENLRKTEKNTMIDIKPSSDYLNRTSGGSFSNFSMLFAGESDIHII